MKLLLPTLGPRRERQDCGRSSITRRAAHPKSLSLIKKRAFERTPDRTPPKNCFAPGRRPTSTPKPCPVQCNRKLQHRHRRKQRIFNRRIKTTTRKKSLAPPRSARWTQRNS